MQISTHKFRLRKLICCLYQEYFVSGFNLLIPVLSRELHIPPRVSTWPASAFALAIAACLLPFGRLVDIHGGHVVYRCGLLWFIVWSTICGFSVNAEMLIACRAMQGLGPAAFLPAGISLIGGIYRPGPRKNIVFSLYGAFAPISFFIELFSLD